MWPTTTMRTRLLLVIAGAVAMGCRHSPPSLLATSESPDMFEPGAEWRDTNGDRIEAHGGGILTIGGTS
jgi:hypothetical protein